MVIAFKKNSKFKKIIQSFTGIFSLGAAIGSLYLRSRFEIEGSVEKLSAPLIIFDFDGVICDSFDTVLTSINEIAPEYGLKPVNLSQKEYYRQRSSKEFIQELGISKFQLVKIVSDIRKNLGECIEEIPPFEDTLEVIRFLKSNGYSMGIVTSNSINNVKRYLNMHDINHFDFIVSTGPFAKAKAFRTIISSSKVNPKNIYYICDESRDIESAKPHNIRTVAVTWGYQTSDALAKYNPDYMINTPEELFLHLNP